MKEPCCLVLDVRIELTPLDYKTRALPLGLIQQYFWCPRRDSNSHAFQQRLLKPQCLPFHHQGIYRKARKLISLTVDLEGSFQIACIFLIYHSFNTLSSHQLGKLGSSYNSFFPRYPFLISSFHIEIVTPIHILPI